MGPSTLSVGTAPVLQVLLSQGLLLPRFQILVCLPLRAQSSSPLHLLCWNPLFYFCAFFVRKGQFDSTPECPGNRRVLQHPRQVLHRGPWEQLGLVQTHLKWESAVSFLTRWTQKETVERALNGRCQPSSGHGCQHLVSVGRSRASARPGSRFSQSVLHPGPALFQKEAEEGFSLWLVLAELDVLSPAGATVC